MRWSKINQIFRNSASDLIEASLAVDQYGTPQGPQGMGNAAGYSAFGETMTESMTPVLQLDGLYGIDPRDFETYAGAGSGAVDLDGPLMTVNTGTGLYGYGVLRSRRSVRYRPGQGAVTRFTACFTAGTAGYTQRAGFFTQEQALQVGFNGTQFGVLRENQGKAVIYKLQITSASTGAETATITLNGTPYAVPVSSGTIQQNATELGNTAFAGYILDYNQDSITFLSASVGLAAGAISVSSDGTFAGTITAVQAGAANVTEWTSQNDFNHDKLDGTGPSGAIIDPTKLNVYQIDFRWLGAGEIRFCVENPVNGDMITFHHIHYTNKHTVPHLDNPSLKVGYVAASLGGSGTDVKVAGASIMGAIQGQIINNKLSRSSGASRSSMNSPGTQYHMLTLHNGITLNNRINSKELILKTISAGCTAAAGTPATITLWFNQSLAVDRAHTSIDANWSPVSYSNQETTITPSTVPLFEFVISPGAATIVDLEALRIICPPGNHITASISSSSNIATANIVLNWVED